MNNKEYFLDNDDSGHWYIVPLEKLSEWNEWVETESEDSLAPDYVKKLGCHPRYLAFQAPRDTLDD